MSELPLLTAPERKQLAEWNSTGIDYPNRSTVHGLFETVARQHPQAVALVYRQQRLSYAELNAQANRLAHWLLAQGVGPEKRVALCISRCPEMVMGILAILKAGAVYVPVDPAYPKDRQAYLLQDAGCEWLLTSTALLPGLDYADASTMCVDNVSAYADHSGDNPQIQLHADHAAYVIYTSGSTGKPKGVVVSHGNLMHSTNARFANYQEPVSCYLLLLSSFAFDSSVAGLFWTLGQGGCLCLPEDDQIKDPAVLAELIAAQKVSHLLALPSFYALLVKQAGAQLQTLKASIVAGEVCSTEVVRQHYAALPQVPLYNEYGPTEGSVWSSVYPASSEDLDRPLSIGRPISNVRLYILDRIGNPAPVGVQGELHIGGAGVARGYWQRPELTADKFIPDPFQADGGRLYKTGDLARYRPDGNIEFLGRIDDQVKIRGFRIELGEIEARLVAHPDVDEAVVLVRENQQLIACVVGSTTLTAEALRDNLKSALPAYMLPGAVVLIDRMPRTANGKLDRKALLSAIADGAESKTKNDSPASETETRLAAIWRGLLGVEHVGKYDDFFDLGGHSLLVIELVFAIQKNLGAEVALVDVFEHPTLAGQVKLIDGDRENDEFLDLEAEASLAPEIVPTASAVINVAEAKALLLTGSTGFLGVFLLAELLEKTQAKIYCLIRAVDEQEALIRLQRQIGCYELQDGFDWSRVIAVCGDLSEPQLGLSEIRYEEIAAQVEVIYHNGALVNFIQPYKALKAANVLGTEEVLRLASYRKAKAIHYVSTLSVFSEVSANPQGYQENDELKISANLVNGYAQSKWVAEKLVRLARDRGFQVSIYRPATVAGDSRSGIWNTEDFMCRLIKACIQLGYAPVERVHMDIAPVDYISRSVVALSLLPDSIGACFHLNHPTPPYFDELIDGFSRSGYRLDRIPYRDWVKKVLETGEANRKDFALLPLLSMFSDQNREDEAELLAEDAIRYDCSETHDVLSKLGIECALLDGELLTRYQAYFKRSGFVREPEYYQ